MLNNKVHRNKNMCDGLYKQCRFCRKKYYNENLVKIRKILLDNHDRKKDYYSKNCDKVITREKIILIIDMKQISFFV